MREHKILTRTLIILSIINFALTAPAAVRGRPEVYLDANVIKDVTATSQKRWDSLDEGGLMNVPDLNYAPPPSPDLTDILRQIAEQQRYIDGPPPPPPDSPGSLAGSDYVPPSPGLPTGSHPGPTGGPPLPPLPHPGPPEDRFPSLPGFPVNPDAFSSTDHQPTPPQSPTGGSPLPDPGPSERFPSPPGWSVNPGTLPSTDVHFPSPPGFQVNPDTLSSTGHQRTPPESPIGGFPLHHLPHPGPSEDSFPPGFSLAVNPDTLSSTGSNQPTPSQSPGVDSEIHSLLDLESFPTEFWDKFLRGKIKRSVSGSGAVNLAQKDPRSRIF